MKNFVDFKKVFDRYDAFEVQPCMEIENTCCTGPEHMVEVCEPEEAHFWTVYGHLPGQGVEALADCPTEEIAIAIKKALDYFYLDI